MKELEESKILSTRKHSKSMSRESATGSKGNVKSIKISWITLRYGAT